MTIPQQDDKQPEQVSTGEQDISSIFSDFDLYLFGQGKHYRIYEKMGAHPRTVHGVDGVNFAIWAPNALSVSVIGNFNGGRHHANHMHLRSNDLSLLKCFIPGFRIREIYDHSVS